MKIINRIRYSLKYISYSTFAKHSKGHGIHSPFLYHLITEVFNNKSINSDLKKVFTIYDKYKKSHEIIDFNEIGAKSNVLNPARVWNPRRVSSTYASVSRIIKTSSVNKKYGKLLYCLIQYFKCKDIIELGSSVGISSAFIAQAIPDSNFISLEGVPEKVKIAKKIAVQLNQKTKFIEGNFDKKLESVLSEFKKLDFVFFDGNHTKEATLKYFKLCLSKIHNDSIFVFDDIHWSKEMEEAWEEIKNNLKVKLSIDLFRMGLIFFRKELSKEHYVIKF